MQAGITGSYARPGHTITGICGQAAAAFLSPCRHCHDFAGGFVKELLTKNSSTTEDLLPTGSRYLEDAK